MDIIIISKEKIKLSHMFLENLEEIQILGEFIYSSSIENNQKWKKDAAREWPFIKMIKFVLRNQYR